MALNRIPVKKSLFMLAFSGLMAIGGAGVAGAAGANGSPGPAGTAAATGTAPKAARPAKCANASAHLARMRARQAALSAKVLRLSASGDRAAMAGKAHRAAVFHRDLAHWRKVQARIVNAKFVREEARLAALASGACHAASAAVPPGTATT